MNARLFTELGALVIDADALAREVMTPGNSQSKKIHEAIRSAFLEDDANLYPDGELDRKALGAIVFADKAKLEKLNALVHPHVQALFSEKVRAASATHIVYDVPLLFENEMQHVLKKTMVVYCPEGLAITRAAQRSNATEAEIKARVDSQISIEEKRKMADYVIDNSTSLEHCQKQVRQVWAQITAGEF